MTEVRGIIYDCDGVLFDSRRANLAFYRHVLEYFDKPLLLDESSPEADLCHTHASAVVFEVLLGEARVAEAQAFAARTDLHFLLDLMTPEEGMPDILELLAGRVDLALATNRGHSVRDLLRHFRMLPHFQTIVTSQDVQRPKPSPDMLLLAVEGLGLSPDEVLFVGDSDLDSQAAYHAGVRFVAYKGLVESELVIQNHMELLTLLDRSPQQD